MRHKVVDYWAEDKKCWRECTKIPQSLGGLYSVCQLTCDKLLVTGGCGDSEETANCWLLDLVNTTWTQMPPLSTGRSYHRNIVLDQYVYVVGGRDASKKAMASVERVDVVQRQWSSLTDLPRAMYAPSVISYDQKIYVFGGVDGDGKILSCVHVYDSVLRQWLTLPDMPEACTFGAAVSIGGFVYLVGGGSRSCLRFDPATDQWTLMSRPRLVHSNAPAVVWEGGILVGGDGGSGKMGSAAIEHYDPVTDKWTDWQAPLKEPLMAHAMFSVVLSGV